MSERDEDKQPESISGDELEPVSLRDLRAALGPGATPGAASPPKPPPAVTNPKPAEAASPKPPAVKPAPGKAPPAPAAKPVVAAKPAAVAKPAPAKIAPKPPRPPRPPLRSVPDTGVDLSAKDLEAFAAMSGSSPPPPMPATQAKRPSSVPPPLPVTTASTGTPAADAPKHVRGVPKPPPRRALSSQNDEAELARGDSARPPAAQGEDPAWQRPPDSGLQDLRMLASLSAPPDRGSAPDDVFVAPEALAAPLLPPDLRQLTFDTPASERPPPSSRTAGKSARGAKSATKSRKERTQTSSTPPTTSVAPEAPRHRYGLYAIAGAALIGGGYLIWGRSPTPTADPTPAPTVRPTEETRPPTAPADTAPPAATETAAPDPTTTESAAPAPHHTSAPIAHTPTGDPRPSTTAEPAPTTTPTAKPTAKPTAAAGTGDFDKGAASAALVGAVGQASGCKQPGDPSGVARVQVTFAPSGRVTTANLSGPPFAGTPTGSCIARAFRSASVPPFAGDPVTVSKTVTIP